MILAGIIKIIISQVLIHDGLVLKNSPRWGTSSRDAGGEPNTGQFTN